MNLKQIARKHTTHDGAVTWWLLPYKSLKVQSIARNLATIVPQATWGTEENTFVWIEGVAVEVEFSGALSPELERLKLYLNERPTALGERYEAFSMCFSTTLADAFWDAYIATRDPILEATEQDPEASTVAAN